ncbi:MAG: hypothetical protein V3U65_07915 [Granulosicoccaceae bacterium]
MFKTFHVVTARIPVLFVGVPTELIAADDVPKINSVQGLTEFRVDIVTNWEENRIPEGSLKIDYSSIAAVLSDQDIALIAAWYQSVSGPRLVK